MKALLSILLLASLSYLMNAQDLPYNKSIHQTQLEHYNSLDNSSANYYENLSSSFNKTATTKSSCNLNKVVYGWHPYWGGSTYQNYQWELLSHFSFFSYEVNASDGEAVSTHGWTSSSAVDSALASGNTKVTLTVTLFANHSTFFSNTIAQQTLISNLINLVQSRGAHGVNIDFESLPSSNKIDFAYFMVNLANQMHAAILNSEVSTVLYAVDWNDVFDFTLMEPTIDQYIIMGYDYYYKGSSTAGPCDPLYHFGSSYNYTLSKSITYYLDKGCPSEKLILGLPYYGYEWSTLSSNIPSSTTTFGSSKKLSYVMNNTSGDYSQANHQFDDDSYTDIYVYSNAGNIKQCFIAKESAFKKRLEHVNVSGIGGIGIWALGYDDGYNEFWNAINDYLTDCYFDSCSNSIHDFGGPNKDYYDNEDYIWTIAPDSATYLNIDFTFFDLESNYYYLYIYNGPNTSYPQIQGSPFTGTNSPGNFVATNGSVTFRFYSDIATTNPGFIANYQCYYIPYVGIEESSSIIELSIYPNPSSTIINIENNSNNDTKLDIYNYLGETIESYKLQNKCSVKVDISKFSNGIYFIKLYNSQKIYNFVVNK